MDRKVKCRFCKREVFLEDFRPHLRVMHPELVKEKMSVEKVESMNEASLLLMFSMMEMLHEVPGGGEINRENFKGKGGEFGGAGANGPFEDCGEKAKCEFCDSYKPEQESEPSSDDSGSNDNKD